MLVTSVDLFNKIKDQINLPKNIVTFHLVLSANEPAKVFIESYVDNTLEIDFKEYELKPKGE